MENTKKVSFPEWLKTPKGRKTAVAAAVTTILLLLAAVLYFTFTPILNEQLSLFIDCEIAAQNEGEHTKDNLIVVDKEIISVRRFANRTTVYMWAYYGEYSFEYNVKEESASHILTVITVEKQNGSYHLSEYWTPSDGSRYLDSVKEKMPFYIPARLLDSSNTSYEQQQRCFDKAREYFSVGEWSSFDATVIDVKDQIISIDIDDGLQSSGEAVFSLESIRSTLPKPTLKVGDRIRVIYDGVILYSYPASFSRIYAVLPIEGNEIKTDNADLLISASILENELQTDFDSDYNADYFGENHEILATMTTTDPVSKTELITYYLRLVYKQYQLRDREVSEQLGGSYPVAVTFERRDDGCLSLYEFWQPRDGSYYSKDIKSKFPASTHDEAFDNDGGYKKLSDSLDTAAEEFYFSRIEKARVP